LLQPRVRVILLLTATVGFASFAIVLGLPPQPRLPAQMSPMIVLPDVPASTGEHPLDDYTVQIVWSTQYRPAMTSSFAWDSYWGRAGLEDAAEAEPVFVATRGESADMLAQCASEESPAGTSGSRPAIEEIDRLPAPQEKWLNDLDLAEYGATRGDGWYRYFRLADRTFSERFGEARCDTDQSVTGDDVELHVRTPRLTVVVPEPDRPTSESGASDAQQPVEQGVLGDGVTVQLVSASTPLPSGWTADDMSATVGSRAVRFESIVWYGEPRDSDLARSPSGYTVVDVGPLIVEATSVAESRRADRNLFWSGLLVGLAGSTLLMLFEEIPWRTRGRRHPDEVGA
jgi:hypothetical protein